MNPKWAKNTTKSYQLQHKREEKKIRIKNWFWAQAATITTTKWSSAFNVYRYYWMVGRSVRDSWRWINVYTGFVYFFSVLLFYSSVTFSTNCKKKAAESLVCNFFFSPLILVRNFEMRCHHNGFRNDILIIRRFWRIVRYAVCTYPRSSTVSISLSIWMFSKSKLTSINGRFFCNQLINHKSYVISTHFDRKTTTTTATPIFCSFVFQFSFSRERFSSIFFCCCCCLLSSQPPAWTRSIFVIEILHDFNRLLT